MIGSPRRQSGIQLAGKGFKIAEIFSPVWRMRGDHDPYGGRAGEHHRAHREQRDCRCKLSAHDHQWYDFLIHAAAAALYGTTGLALALVTLAAALAARETEGALLTD